MDFWSFIWFFIWSFLFIAYLMVLFSILGDLFSDRELNGWLKAIWVIFLIFVPFLTALIYLVTRGQSMAERRGAEIQAAQKETDSYIRTVAGTTNPAEQIAQAKKLLDDGAITAEEFASLKAKVLA